MFKGKHVLDAYLVFSRLAKLLLQWDTNFSSQSGKSSSSQTSFSASTLQSCPQFLNESINALTRSHSQENVFAKQGGCQFLTLTHSYVFKVNNE